jgi:hypothetical protein
MEARVTVHSQVHRLRERMVEAQLQHGKEVRADLPGIRVASGREAWFAAQGCGGEDGVVFFCSMAAIRVREVLNQGDGNPLPDSALVAGLVVPISGWYDLLNAVVRSNGHLEVVLDSESRIVPALSQSSSLI